MDKLNKEYVDIHGRDVKVKIDNDGKTYVPLEESLQIGFNIFRKDNFTRGNHKIDVTKDLNLHLLDAAQKYLLNRYISFNEDEILNAITTCREKCMNPMKTECGVKPSINDTDSFLNTTQCGSSITTDNESSTFSSRENVQNHSNSEEQLFQKVVPYSGNATDLFDYYSSKKALSISSTPIPINENVSPSNIQQESSNMIRNKFQPIIEFNKSITFEIEKEYNVIVTYIENVSNIVWVQDEQKISQFEYISGVLNDQTIGLKEELNPVIGGLYCAKDKATWYRCKVQYCQPLKVQFVDTGSVAHVSVVYILPMDLQSIPFLAVKIIFSLNTTENTVAGAKLKIYPQKQNEGGAYYVNIINNCKSYKKISPQITASCPNGFGNRFESSDQRYNPLTKNETVIINNFLCHGRLVLRTLRGLEEFLHIDTKLRQTRITAKHVVQNPKKGFVAIYCNGNSNTNERIMIESINDSKQTAEIIYLDVYKKDCVELKHLYICPHVEFRHRRKTYVLSPPLRGFTSCSFDSKMSAFLNEIAENDVKFLVTSITDDNVSLQSCHHNYDLSDKLMNLDINKENVNSSKTTVSKVVEKITARCMITDMKVCEPNASSITVIIGDFKDFENFTFIDVCDENIKHLVSIQNVSITEDLDGYIPIVGEVCMGLFEACWYRAVIVHTEDSFFECSFIDYGNSCTLTSSQLRPLHDTLKAIPILGIQGRIIGLTPEHLPTFSKFINDGDNKAVKIIKLNGDRYDVEVLGFPMS